MFSTLTKFNLQLNSSTDDCPDIDQFLLSNFRLEHASRNVLLLFIDDLAGSWHSIRSKRLQSRYSHLFFFFVKTIVFSRSFDSVVHVVIVLSRRNGIHVNHDGPKLIENSRAKIWPRTPRSNSKNAAMNQLNTIENCGKTQV